METKEIIKSIRICSSTGYCEGCIYDDDSHYDCPERLLLIAADRLEQQKTEIAKLKQQSEWISVEEKVPEEKQELFMCLKDGEKFLVLRGFYENSEWCIYTGVTFYTRCDDIPSFWAPAEIIEPPKPKVPTFKDVFLKAFPKATILNPAVTIDCCAVFPWLLDEEGFCHMDMTCKECWEQPYFEKEGGE